MAKTKRCSGVLLPIFSLPGKFGCGTLGQSAYEWIDLLKKGGFSRWQVLPIGITDGHNSPYMSYSSFAGNPYFIDPHILFVNGLVTKQEEDDQTVSDPYLCDYKYLAEKRFLFLKKAASRVKDKSKIEKFLSDNPNINKSCTFLSLSMANNGKAWNEWTVKTPAPDDLAAWQFIQYEFHRQWNLLHEYAQKNDIEIIGDLPFYVSYNSYDVYSSPNQFFLNEDNRPTKVAGVPPDYFCSEGQLWGNPLYNWSVMEQDGYARWKERLGYTLSMFDGVRIDHFRAISAFWSIPADAKTAKEGKWEKGPGEKLIDAFAEVSGEKLILAENLGLIDKETNELLSYSGYPGMAVFQFGFDGNPLSPHLPHNYEKNLIAYTGTHDNNTLLGFLWELDDKTRESVTDYLGHPADSCKAVLRTLMSSCADTVIFPVQDLLGYGADTRINTPGRAEGNWQYRITEEQMNGIDMNRFKHMNRLYAR